MILLTTWQKEVARVGEYWARQNLRYHCRINRRPPNYNKPDELALLHELTMWTGFSPMENRKKFKKLFRDILNVIRNRRIEKEAAFTA